MEDFAFIASTRRDIDISKFKLEVENEINSVKLYDETLKTIDMLRQREINIGLISNLATPYKKPFFDFGLDKLVDEYLFSCEVGCKKPEEKIFKIMSNRLEVPFSEIIMIGDSLSSDFHGAIKAGMNAVLLDRKGIKNITPRIKSLDEIIRYIQKNF